MSSQRISIDYCLRYVPQRGSSCIIMSGWVALSPGKKLVAVVEGNGARLIDCHSWHRSDVSKLLGPCMNPSMRGYGFLGAVWGLGSGPVSIFEADATEIVPFMSIDPDAIYDLQDFMDQLLAMPLPWIESAMSYKTCLPALREALNLRNRVLKDTGYDTGSTGPALTNPSISFIISIGSSLEFLKTQLLALSEDQERMNEIILIINHTELFDYLTEILADIIPFLNTPVRWIAPRIDMSDVEAWNLGASQSQGTNLIFLNGRSVPISSGWQNELTRLLSSGAKAVISPVRPISQQSTPAEESFAAVDYAGFDYSAAGIDAMMPEFPIAIRKADFLGCGGFDCLCRSPRAALKDLRMRAGWPEPTVAELSVVAPADSVETEGQKRSRLWDNASLQLKMA